jgi:hypothetical protein
MDDIFSGLDRKSATHIFSAVFSDNGLLSKLNCAAVLVTHSSTSSAPFLLLQDTYPP